MSSSGQSSVTTDCADSAHGVMTAMLRRQRHVRPIVASREPVACRACPHATTGWAEGSLAERVTCRAAVLTCTARWRRFARSHHVEIAAVAPWPQSYDPLHSALLSTLAAASPLV